MRKFLCLTPALHSGESADSTISASSSVFELSDIGVAQIVWVSMWAVCLIATISVGPTPRGVVATSHKPKMERVHATRVVADVVNGGFVGSSHGRCDWNITNEKLIRKSVGFELAFLQIAQSLDDDSVTKSVTRADPIPAIGEWVKLDRLGKASQQWARRFSYRHERILRC